LSVLERLMRFLIETSNRAGVGLLGDNEGDVADGRMRATPV
jgi:hypothetical protein